MLFSIRQRLADAYEEWVKRNSESGVKIKDCPLTVITFLDGEGWFDNREQTIREVWKDLKDYNVGTDEWRTLFQLKYGIREKTEKEKLTEEIVEEIIDKVDDMIGGKLIAQALREIYEVEE